MKTSYLCRVVCPSVCGDRWGKLVTYLGLFICPSFIVCGRMTSTGEIYGVASTRLVMAQGSQSCRLFQGLPRPPGREQEPSLSTYGFLEPTPLSLGGHSGEVLPGSPLHCSNRAPLQGGYSHVRLQRYLFIWSCPCCTGQKFLEAPDTSIAPHLYPLLGTSQWRRWKSVLKTLRIMNTKKYSS